MSRFPWQPLWPRSATVIPDVLSDASLEEIDLHAEMGIPRDRSQRPPSKDRRDCSPERRGRERLGAGRHHDQQQGVPETSVCGAKCTFHDAAAAQEKQNKRCRLAGGPPVRQRGHLSPPNGGSTTCALAVISAAPSCLPLHSMREGRGAIHDPLWPRRLNLGPAFLLSLSMTRRRRQPHKMPC